MNSNEDSINSLCQFLEQIIPQNDYCPSIQYLIYTVEDWEANIEELEKRLQYVQQEIKKLRAR